MRIAILHNSSPGGARRLVHEIATRLAGDDEVTIYTWGITPEVASPGVEGVWCPGPELHLRPPLHPFANLARSYFGSVRAAAKVDAGGFDVALVFACQWAQAPEALRRLCTPTVYFAQEGRRRSLEVGYLPSGSRGGWRRGPWAVGRRCYDAVGSRLDRRAITSAQVVAANSEFTACRLAEAYGIPAEVIELGVAVAQFRPGATPSEDPVALLVGALDPSKGAELAVRSLAQIPEKHRPALRLVSNRGDDAFGAMVVGLGESLGVTVQVLRNISDDELVREYQSAAFLFALAPNEPFGLTVLEASASGTPTIALDQGGYRRTVDPAVNGILVGAEPANIASAVSDIVCAVPRFDPTTMARWTRERWSWDRCVKDLRDLLVVTSQHQHMGQTNAQLGRMSNPR